MSTFQVHDTVVLKNDHTLVGSIERTSLLDSEPLDDCLIIAHTDVPVQIIQDFVRTGTPPLGYVFVQFAKQEQGSSLVSCTDLILVDRILDVGDVVRGEDSQMLGTIVDVSCSYILDPVWLPQLSDNGFGAKPANNSVSPTTHVCNASCDPFQPWTSHPHPDRLIADVPFEELKRAQDFMEGDYVIVSDWLGVVDAVDICVIIKLEDNSVVMPSEPEELFIPIPDYDKPLVSLPEYDELHRPHYVSAMQGFGNTIPPEDLECGQFVVTNHKNLRSGKWLQGQYDPKVRPEGHVLMVRCRDLSLHWLMCNAFTPEHHWDAKTPSLTTPYENLTTFKEAREIRRDRRVVLYDPSKPAPFAIDRRRQITENDELQARTKNKDSINLSSNFSVGQRVKFREEAGAAVKYQGHTRHPMLNTFHRIRSSETLGYDLNEFEIVQSSQTAVVRWQDGTISKHPSVTLRKTTLFEADLMPGDLVVAREGMKQRRRTESSEDPAIQYPLLDFNEMEMTLFENPHDLIPARVGIIQNMNPGERLAKVRWYAHPSIRIAYSGNALGPESRFGPIGDEIEDVSIYEVMSFPSLVRKLRDIVTFTPHRIPLKAVEALQDIASDDFLEVSACVTTLSQIPDRHPMALLEYMQHNARKSLDDTTPRMLVEEHQDKPHHRTDWAAEICQLRTDGTVVVRANFGENATDIMLEHDQILAIVDDTYWGIDHTDPMDIYSDTMLSDASDMSTEAIEETVEYEGGERLDNDPGDENWESDDEDEPPSHARRSSLAHMDAAGEPELAVQKRNLPSGIGQMSTDSKEVTTQIKPQRLATYLPRLEPPVFLSLDMDPPSDQFRASSVPSTSAFFLKRIAREHRILANGLPRHEIYVRTYDSRLDLLRCLIIGPLDTPYECAPFLIDLHLGTNFPKEPPTAHFHSWTSGMGRVNPNLYEEGKICLSLLGTWPGKSETEGWTEKATLLQLLVSLLGLTLNRKPFFNEAGFEGAEGYRHEALQYSEKAYVMARNFVKHALNRPVGALEDVLAWLYLPDSSYAGQLDALRNDGNAMLRTVITRGRALIARSEDLKGPSKQLGGEDEDDERLLSGDGKSGDVTKVFLKPLSRGSFVMLNRTLKSLEETLDTEIQAMVEAPSS